MVMSYIKLKTIMNALTANILPADPTDTTPNPGDEINMSKFTFVGHAAYQIKWNHKI